MKTRRWIPYPTSWASSHKWHELTPRARVLLFCVWAKTPDGEVPQNPKAFRILAGVPDRPKRIEQAFQELTQTGFIVQEGPAFFLAQWRQIFAKFGKKRGQSGVNNLRTNRTKTTGSATSSRARAFPPKGGKKEREEEGTNTPGGRSSFSSQLDPRVFDILEANK